MRRIYRKGFTLVEIMIVVAIIGLLAAIAIPNFLTARTTAQTRSCLANVRTLQGIVEMYMIDTGNTVATSTDLLTGYDLSSYYRTTPSCPTTGTYVTTGSVVSCSAHGTP